MVVSAGSGDFKKPTVQAYKDKSKPADIRASNINAAKCKYAFRHMKFLT